MQVLSSDPFYASYGRGYQDPTVDAALADADAAAAPSQSNISHHRQHHHHRGLTESHPQERRESEKALEPPFPIPDSHGRHWDTGKPFPSMDAPSFGREYPSR